jgi:hypothetical protein
MAPTADKPGPREETPQTVTPSTTPPAKRSRRPAGRPRPGQDTGEEYELVRSPDYDTTGTWDVMADGNRVGQVRPLHRLGSGKAWTAHDPATVLDPADLALLRQAMDNARAAYGKRQPPPVAQVLQLRRPGRPDAD